MKKLILSIIILIFIGGIIAGSISIVKFKDKDKTISLTSEDKTIANKYNVTDLKVGKIQCEDRICIIIILKNNIEYTRTTMEFDKDISYVSETEFIEKRDKAIEDSIMQIISNLKLQEIEINKTEINAGGKILIQ